MAKTDSGVRNNCTLRCGPEEYASLYIEVSRLYEAYEPLNYIKHRKGKQLSEELSLVNTGNPMGGLLTANFVCQWQLLNRNRLSLGLRK